MPDAHPPVTPSLLRSGGGDGEAGHLGGRRDPATIGRCGGAMPRKIAALVRDLERAADEGSRVGQDDRT